MPLIRKDTQSKWIDFWVICDKTRAYLFYTQSQNTVMVRTTSLEEFPNGWGAGESVFGGVTEAAHIYKVKAKNEFHMIYEQNRDGVRSFGLASAENLAGPWEKVTDRFATGEQLRYFGDQQKWTEMVSHGEAIRTGYDQQIEYNPNGYRWLVQGTLKKYLDRDYALLPWQLGIISRSESRGATDSSADVDEALR